jgi:hypothetical protein
MQMNNGKYGTENKHSKKEHDEMWQLNYSN